MLEGHLPHEGKAFREFRRYYVPLESRRDTSVVWRKIDLNMRCAEKVAQGILIISVL